MYGKARKEKKNLFWNRRSADIAIALDIFTLAEHIDIWVGGALAHEPESVDLTCHELHFLGVRGAMRPFLLVASQIR